MLKSSLLTKHTPKSILMKLCVEVCVIQIFYTTVFIFTANVYQLQVLVSLITNNRYRYWPWKKHIGWPLLKTSDCSPLKNWRGKKETSEVLLLCKLAVTLQFLHTKMWKLFVYEAVFVCGGALSCWNRNRTNCWHNAGRTLLSKIAV